MSSNDCSMQSSNSLDDIIVQKAKRKDGVYVCNVYLKGKQPFCLWFPSATILDTRKSSNTIIVQSKKMNRYMDELNERIIAIVKENTYSWFNTNIDEELIDEYFISTLGFNKKCGEFIRLKLTNIEELEDHVHANGKYDINLTLRHIKFYKQKFYPEFQIEEIKPAQSEPVFVDDESDDFVVDEEEDEPLPSFDEVDSMRHDFLTKLGLLRDTVHNQVSELQDKLKQVESHISNLQNCSDVHSIIKACDECQNFVCE